MQNAGLMRRLAAILYDSMLLFGVGCLATVPFVVARGGVVEPGTSAALQVTLFTVVYLFFVGYWTRSGRTLGMQSWGLRIEAVGGGLPPLSAATIRFGVAMVSWAAFGIGFLWSLVDREGLTWHDRASGTRLRYYPKTKKTENGR